ncbi:MAG: hypothetical protein QOC93_3796 [Actinomycetota bacterium]|nr:hypothetical protein [Cryptosporangiaceae bacterium]MDQ1678652.1 hypothetical protein [Actinomycetota bacterium]
MTASPASATIGWTTWARRLLLVLPVLAAVFLMHGVQCNGDDHTTMAQPTVGGMAHAMASGPTGTNHPGGGVEAAPPGEIWLSPTADAPPASPSLAGVCLVLLTAGLVVLRAVLACRRHGLESPPGGGVEIGPPGVTAARRPSLAQLCLLRI